jgi:hypothetical protein
LALVNSAVLREAAFEMLEGFGDASLGEWIDDRPKGFHLRRRLTAKEQELVGEAVDCRGGEEGIARFRRMKTVLPAALYPLIEEELGPGWLEA